MTDMVENIKLRHGWMSKDVRIASGGRFFHRKSSLRPDGELKDNAIVTMSRK